VAGFKAFRITAIGAVTGTAQISIQAVEGGGAGSGGSGGGGGSVDDWGDIGGTLSNQTDLQAALDAKSDLGLVGLDGTDITASRALTSADFAGSILSINAAGVVAITVPTVSAMSLAATAGKVRACLFYVEGAGIPTFAGATASTSQVRPPLCTRTF
jgi:hypothetical protein